MNFALFIEIFGYIGTALVIISMLMTSVVKLRVINMCGALISGIYAVLVSAWPIVLTNATLLIIQIVQLYRICRQQKQEQNAAACNHEKGD